MMRKGQGWLAASLALVFFLCAMLAVAGAKQEGAPTSERINISMSFGLTGWMGPWAEPMAKAGQLAIDEINADGGVLGKTLNCFTEDNKSTVEGSINAAQKLVNVYKVSVIIGPESDPVTALIDFAKEKKVPIISTSGGTMAIDKVGGKGNFIYRTCASDSFIGVAAADVVKNSMKYDKVVVMYENLEGSTSMAESFIDNYKKIGGQIMEEVVLTPDQLNYSSELKKIYDLNPPAVYVSISITTGIKILKGKYEKGHSGDIIGTSELMATDLVDAVGIPGSKCLKTVQIVEAEQSAGWRRFVEVYEKRYGEKPAPAYFASNTYDAVVLAALAMVAAKNTSGAAIDNYLTEVAGPPGVKVYSFADGVKELKKGNDIDYEGSSGPCDFNKYGNVAGPAVGVLQVDDKGEWQVATTVDTSKLPF